MTHKPVCASQVTDKRRRLRRRAGWPKTSAGDRARASRAEPQKNEREPFEVKMKRQVAELHAQHAEGAPTRRRHRRQP